MTLKPLNLDEEFDRITKRGTKTSPEIEDYKNLIAMAADLPVSKERLLTIKQASILMGVSQQTLRNWETDGRFVPVSKTVNGHRRYSEAQVNEFKRREMQDCEIILPDLKPAEVLDMVQQALSNFDPEQNVSIIVTSSLARRKVFITVDSEDGLSSITKIFKMEN